MARYLIAGAAGYVGSRLAEQLLARGESVRGLVRDPDNEAVERLAGLGMAVWEGDVTQPESLVGVANGVEYVYNLTSRSVLENGSVAVNDASFDQTERGGTAGLNYRLTERLSLRAAAETQHLDYRALQRRDRLSDYEAGLLLRETPHWSYRLTLTHRQRSSNVAGEGYSANEIYFGVEFRR